jgi:Zn finger protein HypA/HybF involved in hydrogenase expression
MMKLIKEGQPIAYKTINGQEIPVIQPEVYQRIYCKSCENEVDSEEQAIGTCAQCGQPWSTTKAVDIKVNILEMPPMGAESGD